MFSSELKGGCQTRWELEVGGTLLKTIDSCQLKSRTEDTRPMLVLLELNLFSFEISIFPGLTVQFSSTGRRRREMEISRIDRAPYSRSTKTARIFSSRCFLPPPPPQTITPIPPRTSNRHTSSPHVKTLPSDINNNNRLQPARLRGARKVSRL